MGKLLGGLCEMGWVLKCCVDISKKERDKGVFSFIVWTVEEYMSLILYAALDSLLFRYQSPPPPPCDWMSISFLQTDKLYLLDAPEELRNAIVNALTLMIQRVQEVKGSIEIKLKGGPWIPSGEETVTTRIIALTLLEVLESHGYSLYASIDQDIGPGGRETDTWHCCRQKDWQPGQPVFHS